MMLWGNTNYNFMQAAMGWSTDWNFDWAIHTRREFTQPLLVSYMESHDEERLMFKNIKYGNESGNYKIKTDTLNSLKRNGLATAFYLTIPGPRMIWQFGELGYDYSRCYLSTGGREDGECDRKTDSKPIRWDYLQQPARKQLYDLHAKLLKLRRDFQNVFISSNITHNLASAFKTLQLTHADLNITVVGNFDVNTASSQVSFQHAGTWYNYLTGETIVATGQPQQVTLNAGEYRYYIDRNLTTPTGVNDIPVDNLYFKLKVFPSPGSDAKVEFTLPEDGNVRLTIINNLGQVVTSYYAGFKRKGTYTIGMKDIPGAPRKAGVYFMKINAIQKMGVVGYVSSEL